MLIAQHLNFDVARVLDELFDEAAIVAKRRLGFGARELEPFLGFLGVVGDAHSLAAATGGGLDHHRIADLVGDLHRLLGVADFAEVAGNGRNLGCGRCLLTLDLVAHRGDRLGVRADEDDAVLLKGARECFALGQKSISGMDRLGARRFAGLDDLVHDQVGLRGRRRTDVHGFVGHFDVKRVAVGVRIDRHGLDAHLARRLDDATGDFTAVSDQNFFEHGPSPVFAVIACFAAYGNATSRSSVWRERRK